MASTTESRLFKQFQNFLDDERKIPTDSNVSKKYEDQLLSLLQRDPKQRKSLEEFFARHPSLDPEHAPSDLFLAQEIAKKLALLSEIEEIFSSKTQIKSVPSKQKIEKVTCDEDLKHLSSESGELVLVSVDYLMELSKNAALSDNYAGYWSEKEENDYDNNYSLEQVQADIENMMNSKEFTDDLESVMADVEKEYYKNGGR